MTNPEKFDYQTYRDNLTRQIKDEPDKEKRREILEQAEETTEYKNAESEKRDNPESASEGEWDAKKALDGLTNYINPGSLHESGGSHGVFLYRIDEAGETGNVFNKFGDQFATRWKELVNDDSKNEIALVKLLRDKITDKTVIDLGGGMTKNDDNSNAPSFMQGVAEKLGAGVYVNVDRYFEVEMGNPNARPRDNTEELGIKQPPSGMHVIYTENDLLNFLSKMNSESPGVVIALNGIDRDVINEIHIPDCDHDKRGRWYHKRVAEEIARVLPKRSVILSAGSEATKYFEESGLKLLERRDLIMFTMDVWTKE